MRKITETEATEENRKDNAAKQEEKNRNAIEILHWETQISNLPAKRTLTTMIVCDF